MGMPPLSGNRNGVTVAVYLSTSSGFCVCPGIILISIQSRAESVSFPSTLWRKYFVLFVTDVPFHISVSLMVVFPKHMASTVFPLES